MSLRPKARALLAAGGDVAVPVFTAVRATSNVLPPLYAAAGGAVFIIEEVKKSNENKEEWECFGNYIANAVARVAAAMDSYDASSEEVKPWVENITKLDK
ncbi:uncharacterized protein EI90DRAFT_3159095 [Cantharellus anzutake]|uniref:uncharacterized protein n=1 Tax=Cantharellus anzutake TaxID=1750568 RepID=UPI00190778AE|nr:uncharacterized protein EI90DRAFT_3159095 [Cantharellus anzutake]KAF8315745.1 hypothetical protein EI90DRAFT_3159095 [Cantharellus anzutake]